MIGKGGQFFSSGADFLSHVVPMERCAKRPGRSVSLGKNQAIVAQALTMRATIFRLAAKRL